jgi:hypothetical protein
LGLTEEDLDILDIDWKHWQSKNHTIRVDEAGEMGNLLEALSISVKMGVLVLSPSYAQEAELLSRVNWTPSNEEPIDASGAVHLVQNFLPFSVTDFLKACLSQRLCSQEGVASQSIHHSHRYFNISS